MTFYDRFAEYYDMAQGQDSQYQRQAHRMDTVFRAHNVKTILDLACGTGSHLVELAKQGYRCVGQDLSSGMLEVAKRKAHACGSDIEFVGGDVCTFRLNRTFDAVIGLYVFASLVNDKDFYAGLASARQALRPGGVFVFNILNADTEGLHPQGFHPPPRLFLGETAAQANTKLVRLNNTAIQDSLWRLTSIYLIDNNVQTRLEIHEDHLQLRRLEDVKALLADHGFRFESVTYEDAVGCKACDMHVCATAVDK